MNALPVNEAPRTRENGTEQVTDKGKIKKTKIIGKSKAKGIKNYDVVFRLTRLDRRLPAKRSAGRLGILLSTGT